jgi:DNA-binding MarR family transcriptional regulator
MSNPNRHGSRFQALGDFRYEIRRFLNFSERAARGAGIEPHQHQALLAIQSLPARERATIGVLAERLQLQHHSAVELVDRLEKRRLIRRTRNESDRREVLLELSVRGEKLLERLSAAHRTELRVAGPKLMTALQHILHHEAHAREGIGRSKKQPVAAKQGAVHQGPRGIKTTRGR